MCILPQACLCAASNAVQIPKYSALFLSETFCTFSHQDTFLCYWTKAQNCYENFRKLWKLRTWSIIPTLIDRNDLEFSELHLKRPSWSNDTCLFKCPNVKCPITILKPALASQQELFHSYIISHFFFALLLVPCTWIQKKLLVEDRKIPGDCPRKHFI